MNCLMIERACQAKTPDGTTLETKIGLFKPKINDNGAWECELYFGEISSNKRSAYGADNWQATVIGMQMMQMELQVFQWMGWSFSWFQGESNDLSELLPKL